MLGNSNFKYSPIWGPSNVASDEKVKPLLNVQTRNIAADKFATVPLNDSIQGTPKPDRMFNSIMYSEKERQNSIQIPGQK